MGLRSIDAMLAGWVRSASPKGTYDICLSPPARLLDDPQVHFAPALILRKRTERSYLRAFEEIIRQLKDGAPIPPGVSRFVTITEDPEHAREQQDSPAAGSSAEVYSPLESNEAQREIVSRLASHQGVLVQGPPGTGKSHTIVNLICHLLASGQRVLVTSHTGRALKVLQRFIRDKIPDISPLAVVLLGDDRDALEAMENSVQGITNRQNHWDPNANVRRIEDLEAQLNEARRRRPKFCRSYVPSGNARLMSIPPNSAGMKARNRSLPLGCGRKKTCSTGLKTARPTTKSHLCLQNSSKTCSRCCAIPR